MDFRVNIKLILIFTAIYFSIAVAIGIPEGIYIGMGNDLSYINTSYILIKFAIVTLINAIFFYFFIQRCKKYPALSSGSVVVLATSIALALSYFLIPVPPQVILIAQDLLSAAIGISFAFIALRVKAQGKNA